MSDHLRAHGIDYAGSYEDLLDPVALRDSGVRYVFHKASEGIGYADPEYKDDAARLNQAGVMVIPYHYFRPRWDALQQAEWFYQCIKDTAFTAVCVDWETTDNIVPITRIPPWVIAFARRIHELTGKTVILYSGMWFLRKYVEAELKKLAAEIPLYWNAAYWWENKSNYDDQAIMRTIENPEEYPFWPEVTPFEKFLWQWTARGKVAGIGGVCDRDITFGNFREFCSALGIVLPEEPHQGDFLWEVYRFLKTLGYAGPNPDGE